MSNRTMVIGLDGGTWTVIDPLLKQGKLPTIQRVVENGVKGYMHTTIPSQTVPAWPACYTGVNPGKLGAYHFLSDSHMDYDEGSPLTINSLKVKTIWNYLTEHNKFSMSILVPLTFPAQAINGFVVTPGRIDREAGKAEIMTYPRELYDEIQKVLNINLGAMAAEKDKFQKVNLTGFRNARAVSLENMKNLYLTTIKKIGEGTVYLMKKHQDWDFIMLVFTPIDALQHSFWSFMDQTHALHDPELAKIFSDTIAEGYIQADKAIGEILSHAGEDINVLFTSDHGFAPIDKFWHVNEFLKGSDLLKVKDIKPYKLRMKQYQLQKILRRLRLGFVANMLPEKIRQTMVPLLRRDYLRVSELIDWKQTKAYAMSLGININLKGREPQGIVSPEDFDAAVEKVREELYALKDPATGKKIIGEVFTKEELFKGPFVSSAPDIIFLLAEPNYFFKKSFDSGKLFANIPHDYPITSHHINSQESAYRAIFMAYGKNIKHVSMAKSPQIIDIPATAMYLMGLPVPTDMDGRVLTEIIDEDYLKNNPVRYEDIDIYTDREIISLGADEEERIKSRLKDLGYLE